MTMDVRIADRRRRVSEEGARRRLRWGIVIVVAAALVCVGILTLRSPLLAVRRVAVEGVHHADIAAVLRRHGVVAGVPTISVRASRVESAIEADPWVARASVRVAWPGDVEVTVLEHVPSAWIELPNGWMLASASGAILERGAPPKWAPRIRIEAPQGGPGDQLEAPEVVAALEFVASLPAELAAGARVRLGGAGLEARVTGHRVLLGSATEMPSKAAALTALFDEGIAEGADVSLLSPLRPAVGMADAGPQVEVEGTERASSATSG